MSYIGRDIRTGAFRQLDDISSGFDGSDTTHTMQVNSTNVSVGDVNQILLSLGGVIQKPGTDFTVSGSTLTFTTAPAANTSFFAILLGSDNGGTVTPTDASVTPPKTTFFNTDPGNAADLGMLHIKSGDSSATANAHADELVVEGSANSGISILSGASNIGRVNFGDSGDDDIGIIFYDHSDNSLTIRNNATNHMVMSSAGEVTKPLNTAFRVVCADMNNIQISQYHNLQFNDEKFDIGSNFDTSTYTFTAPVTGKYFLNVSLLLQDVDTAAGYYGLRIEASNHSYWDYLHSVKYDSDPTYFPIHANRMMDMDANDTVYVRIYQYQGSAQTDVNGGATIFAGYLLG